MLSETDRAYTAAFMECVIQSGNRIFIKAGEESKLAGSFLNVGTYIYIFFF